MLGFTIAAAFELFQGKDVFEQIKAYPLLTVGTFIAFTVASWIPFLKGQSYNVKSGPFTPAVSIDSRQMVVVDKTDDNSGRLYVTRWNIPPQENCSSKVDNLHVCVE